MVSDSRLRGAILLTLLAAGAGLHAGAEPQPAGAPVALKATLIESGLDFTINLTSPRNDSRRIFILERGGVIWLRKDGVRLPTPFVDLTSVTGGGHEWGVFALAFHPEENNLGRKLNRQWTTGVDDIKTLAISRLMLDNIPHIKAYWVMLTPALAQVALSFGANDMDGTIIEEHIYQEAGAKKQVMTVEELKNFIRVAGYTPVERDTVYNELEVFA